MTRSRSRRTAARPHRRRGREVLGVNRAFREWTRGVSFVLTLGRSQVACLVSIAESIARGYSVGLSHPRTRYYVTAVRGLASRGIIEHLKTPKDGRNNVWRLTAPGEKVVDLLKLSGIYQELAIEFNAFDRKKRAEANAEGFEYEPEGDMTPVKVR